MMRIQKNLVIFTAAALFVMILAAGCTSPGPYNGTPTVTGTTVPGTTVPVATTVLPGTTVPGTTVMPTVTGTRPAAGSVSPVNFNALFAAWPAPPAGWTAQEQFGQTIQNQGATYTMAQQVFNSPTGAEATVTIIDSAYYPVGGWESWNTHTTVQTADGYWKSGTVQGYPSWEWYDAKSNTYSTWVGIRDRFMVMVVVMNGSKSDLDTFVNNVKYSAIAAF